MIGFKKRYIFFLLLLYLSIFLAVIVVIVLFVLLFFISLWEGYYCHLTIHFYCTLFPSCPNRLITKHITVQSRSVFASSSVSLPCLAFSETFPWSIKQGYISMFVSHNFSPSMGRKNSAYLVINPAVNTNCMFLDSYFHCLLYIIFKETLGKWLIKLVVLQSLQALAFCT